MSLVPRRTTTVPGLLGVLTLTLALTACAPSGVEAEDGLSTTTAASTSSTAQGEPPVGEERLTGEDIHEDPERFAALADRMRQEYPALAGAEGPAPVFHGLHLCSVLYADQANERDVQQRYESFLAGFTGEGYVSDETGRHWVDRSIGEFCPGLEPQLVR